MLTSIKAEGLIGSWLHLVGQKGEKGFTVSFQFWYGLSSSWRKVITLKCYVISSDLPCSTVCRCFLWGYGLTALYCNTRHGMVMRLKP